MRLAKRRREPALERGLDRRGKILTRRLSALPHRRATLVVHAEATIGHNDRNGGGRLCQRGAGGQHGAHGAADEGGLCNTKFGQRGQNFMARVIKRISGRRAPALAVLRRVEGQYVMRP